MTYVIAEPCIGTEGQFVRRSVSRGLHPSTPDEPDYEKVDMLFII